MTRFVVRPSRSNITFAVYSPIRVSGHGVWTGAAVAGGIPTFPALTLANRM